MKLRIVIGLLTAAFTFSSAAQYVELTTEIETFDWESSNTGRISTARCVIGTNSWMITGEFSRNASNTWWFSGSNLVARTVITKELPAQEAKRLAHPGFPAVGIPPVGEQDTRVYESTNGNLGKRIRQADLMTLTARICWLAFCSGPVLKQAERSINPPSDLWKELISAPSGFSDKTIAFDDALGLPKRLDLFTAQNQPVLQYRVAGSTNVLGWEFPLEFYLAQYRPVYLRDEGGFAKTGWELEFTAKGKITSIAAGVKPELSTSQE